MIVRNISDAAIGMAGSRARVEVPLAKHDVIAVVESQIRALQRIAVARGDADLATGGLLHPPRARDVIGMAMGIECRGQFQIQFRQQREIAKVLFENGIDDDGLARYRIAEDVGVGRRSSVEELAEDESSQHSCKTRETVRHAGIRLCYLVVSLARRLPHDNNYNKRPRAS